MDFILKQRCLWWLYFLCHIQTTPKVQFGTEQTLLILQKAAQQAVKDSIYKTVNSFRGTIDEFVPQHASFTDNNGW